MKTKEQILRQIKLCIFSDEEWKKVKSFFQQNHGTGIVKPFKGKYDYTFEDLQEWISNGLGVGDMIEIDGVVKIVAYQIKNDICFSAFMKPNGKFRNIESPKAEQYVPCRKVEGQDYWEYVRGIHKQGYNISDSSAVLLYRPVLRKGKMCCFVLNGSLYYGIIKESDKDKTEFYYKYGTDKSFSKEPVVVDTCDVIDTITGRRLRIIEDEIAERFHVRWSTPLKDVAYLPKRVERGKRYYYLNDKFMVTSAEENYGIVANTRYANGNYFNGLREAEDFLWGMRELRSKQIKGETINH